MKRMFITYPEAAQLLGVSRNTVANWTRRGIIPTVRIGKLQRIPRKAFLQWLTQFEVEGTSNAHEHPR